MPIERAAFSYRTKRLGRVLAETFPNEWAKAPKTNRLGRLAKAFRPVEYIGTRLAKESPRETEHGFREVQR